MWLNEPLGVCWQGASSKKGHWASIVRSSSQMHRKLAVNTNAGMHKIVAMAKNEEDLHGVHKDALYDSVTGRKVVHAMGERRAKRKIAANRIHSWRFLESICQCRRCQACPWP